MKFCLLLCFSTLLVFAECREAGEVLIEVNDDIGFKVIYTTKSKLNKGSDVNININKDLARSEDGEIQGVLEKKADEFVYENSETKVKEGDTVHFRVGCYIDQIGDCKIIGQYEYKGAGVSSEIDIVSLTYSCNLSEPLNLNVTRLW